MIKIDIHTHISEYEETEIIQIIKRAHSAGVKNIIFVVFWTLNYQFYEQLKLNFFNKIVSGK